jgi:hypothetical protein
MLIKNDRSLEIDDDLDLIERGTQSDGSFEKPPLFIYLRNSTTLTSTPDCQQDDGRLISRSKVNCAETER